MPTARVVAHCRTELGERLLLAGSSVLLGEWDPLRSQVELRTDSFSYPCWTCIFDFEIDTPLECKLVVCSDRGFRWEDQIANRSFNTLGYDVEVSAAFNCLSCSVFSVPPLIDTKHRVIFNVRCETAPGDRVMIVGSRRSMGRWDPRVSRVELETNAHMYPLWTILRDFRSRTSFAYKFVIVSAGCMRWESIGDRSLCMPSFDVEMTTAFDIEESLIVQTARNPSRTTSLPERCNDTANAVTTHLGELQETNHSINGDNS